MVLLVTQLWGGQPVVSHTQGNTKGTHNLETTEGGASQDSVRTQTPKEGKGAFLFDLEKT